ncbi:hypothetical protein [Desulfovibrio subterraneus]|uniref:Uncharacterized protein n=1 Tax=Desulfovibrio subterraneus TaxID=2718620 RepID=A0A7J0BLZ7_9BACT|nr:hypothetical protein [Desulfovibrio subterraneus]GFM34261.1 hypothetical protein DSM101010T_26260 [Desulfovibrio subterraneus]
MIDNIPTAQDFHDSGKELLAYAWDIVASLLMDLKEVYPPDFEDEEREYWEASKRHLNTAVSIMQQGTEFLLKGEIANVSPYILIAGNPSSWPTPYSDAKLHFNEFRTIDSQDLIKVHDTVCEREMPKDFTSNYNNLRIIRNVIMHSVKKDITLTAIDIIETVLYIHNTFLKNESWLQLRLDYLSRKPNHLLGGNDYDIDIMCIETELIIDLLPPSVVKKYFNIVKSRRAYLCPKCYNDAKKDFDFESKLARLTSRSKDCTTIYCPVCDETHNVIREKCSSCPGNVLSDEGICLTCEEDNTPTD